MSSRCRRRGEGKKRRREAGETRRATSEKRCCHPGHTFFGDACGRTSARRSYFLASRELLPAARSVATATRLFRGRFLASNSFEVAPWFSPGKRSLPSLQVTGHLPAWPSRSASSRSRSRRRQHPHPWCGREFSASVAHSGRCGSRAVRTRHAERSKSHSACGDSADRWPTHPSSCNPACRRNRGSLCPSAPEWLCQL